MRVNCSAISPARWSIIEKESEENEEEGVILSLPSFLDLGTYEIME